MIILITTRLGSITAPVALYIVLFKASFSATQLMDTAALRKFDELLRYSASTITNTDLVDRQWIQARLPVRHGGLGVRRILMLI